MHQYASASIENLVRQVADGDSDAWAALFERLHERFGSWIEKVEEGLGIVGIWDGVMQRMKPGDDKWKRLVGAPERVVTSYLLRAAKWVRSDLHRAKLAREEREEPWPALTDDRVSSDRGAATADQADDTVDVDREVGRRMLRNDLERALRELREAGHERSEQVIRQFHIDDQPIKDIAAEYGIDPDTMSQIKQRNLKRLIIKAPYLQDYL